MRGCATSDSGQRGARTLPGEIAFEREVFECPLCRRAVALADAALGLEPRGQMTRSLVRRAAWLSARTSFADAAADLHELLAVSVSPAEGARVVQAEGKRKHLVKECFAPTGGPWRRRTIPWVLALHVSIANGDWLSHWQSDHTRLAA